MSNIFVCANVRKYEGIINIGPVFTNETDANLWVESEKLKGNSEATFYISDLNPKIHCCKTCTQMRLSAGTCIDMTCKIGFCGGNHDGWTDRPITSIQDKYSVTSKDYTHNLIKERVN